MAEEFSINRVWYRCARGTYSSVQQPFKYFVWRNVFPKRFRFRFI